MHLSEFIFSMNQVKIFPLTMYLVEILHSNDLKMVLLKHLLTLTKIFQILGLAPFSYSVSTSKWETNRSLECITFIFIIVITNTTALPIIFNESFIDYNSEDRISAIISNVMLVTINLHAFCALIENFLKRHRYTKLLNSFRKLEKSFNKTASVRLKYKVIQRMFRNFLIFGSFEVSFLLVLKWFAFLNDADQRGQLFLIIYLIPFIVSVLSYIQAIAYISLLFRIIEAFDRFTDGLVAKSNVSVNRWFATPARFRKNTVDERDLIFLKYIFCLIFECSTIINNLTYWSLPIGIVNELFLLTFNVFWIIGSFFENGPFNTALIVFCTVWITMTSLNILFITTNCERARNQVSVHYVSCLNIHGS